MEMHNGNYKRFCLAGLFLLASVNISFSQWIYQSVPSGISYLLSIDFLDSQTGTATGIFSNGNFTGKAVYTTNAGVDWLPASVPDSSRVLVTAQFINSLTGFCSGAYNTSFAQNKKLPETFTNNFYSATGQLMFNRVNINSAGSNNYKGMFYKTTDGGRSWNTFGNLSDSIYYLTGLYFINSATGYASAQFNVYAGVDDRIIKTTDGGISWFELQMPGTINSLRNIFFTDSNTGFAAGSKVIQDTSRALVIKTTNAGTTWELQTFTGIPNFSDVYFTDWNTGYVTGNEEEISWEKRISVLYKTTNAGLNWILVPLQLQAVTLYGVRFVQGTGTGIIYGGKWGGKSLSNYISKTSDYGQNWINQIQNDSNTIAFGGKLLDQNNWYLCGGFEAKILHSTNGGVGITQISSNIPGEFKLNQNYPNPFNPGTIITYQIPVNNFVTIKVYDILGKELVTLVKERQSTGTYEVNFDGSNLSGGIYFYKMKAGSFIETKKMFLVK